MRFISADQIAKSLDFPDFIEALREGFRSSFVAPVRHHHEIVHADQANSTMLLMPAWTDFAAQGHSKSGYSGVKIVNVSPDNVRLGKASVQAVYLLSAGDSGEPVALIDGQALTFWRTSAASALASDYLSNKDSKRLLMVGSGALAPWLINAHRTVRPIEEVMVWNRNEAGAVRLVEQLLAEGINAHIVSNLQEGVEACDIVSAATLSREPLIKGAWLKPETHVDLVGAFTPQMRESDDEAVISASIFVDTMEGALSEPGDILQPLENGSISKKDILADLFDLTRSKHKGRTSKDQITLFKSTGASLEDLVGAILIAEKVPEG
ncbi:MAG: ornithine cyclodeaminase family protein [Rhizobiaceae bacterium]|nr:ornithine cyclodeaminase family protein [Rhizobiaceae bacterium]